MGQRCTWNQDPPGCRCPHRIVPSRYLEKWKDKGDGYDNKLNLDDIPKHMDAKTRWIIQGFHDPDIEILNSSVPTPETADIPLTLQLISSLQAKAWAADVWGAFTQSTKGLRKEPLFAEPALKLFDCLIPLLAFAAAKQIVGFDGYDAGQLAALR